MLEGFACPVAANEIVPGTISIRWNFIGGEEGARQLDNIIRRSLHWRVTRRCRPIRRSR